MTTVRIAIAIAAAFGIAGYAIAEEDISKYIPRGMATHPMDNETNDDWRPQFVDRQQLCANVGAAHQDQDGNWIIVGGDGDTEMATTQEYNAIRKACGLPLRRR